MLGYGAGMGCHLSFIQGTKEDFSDKVTFQQAPEEREGIFVGRALMAKECLSLECPRKTKEVM